MLDNLTQRLARVMKTIKGEARLTEANISDALREVRLALLEADVALPVVKDFIAAVKEKALGEEVVGSLTPGQALVGVVHREMTRIMGEANVGLNLATQRRDEGSPTHAVFLSGNGPLVAVLREALTRDDVERREARGERATKANAGKPVKAFIQNVHHFRDEALRHPGPPADHVVIFDEAQRAWNKAKAANFMKQRKGIDGFAHSEPEFLMSYMNRHADWAAIVCLVGSGQDRHDALEEHFEYW